MSTISTFQSNATIELHGGTLMAKCDNGRVFPIKGTHLIPGDLIFFPDETLLTRIEQPAIGIVSANKYRYRIEKDEKDEYVYPLRDLLQNYEAEQLQFWKDMMEDVCEKIMMPVCEMVQVVYKL